MRALQEMQACLTAMHYQLLVQVLQALSDVQQQVQYGGLQQQQQQ